MKFKGFLCHVVSHDKMHVGQVLEIGKDYNFFAKRLLGLSFECGEGDVNQLVQTKKFADFTEDECLVTQKYIYESCAVMRELAIELYRQQHCPKLPSRLRCLYVTKSAESAEGWVPALRRMNKSQEILQIVKLKVKGELFEANGNLMLRNTLSAFDKFDMAKKYWSGEDATEILFQGRAEVVEIIKEF